MKSISEAVHVRAPSSKSISHRKLIAAALCAEAAPLSHILECDDIRWTMGVLRAAGATISKKAPGEYLAGEMLPQLQNPVKERVTCFMGASGTSCRLLTAVLAAGKGSFYIHGDERLHERPMHELTDALTSLGASIEFSGKSGHLPLTLHARGLSQKEGEWLPISCNLSSQFLSGLLLAAPLTTSGLRLLLTGKKAVSWPYVGLTLQTLEDAGCSFVVETLEEDGTWQVVDWRKLTQALPGRTRFTVGAGGYHRLPKEKAFVEGDFSGASYLLAAGALGPRPVKVEMLNKSSLQGDAAIIDILTMLGASIAWERESAATVSPAPLRGISLDMEQCPDIVPTVAVLASQAKGETTITGVAHLRVKESDRLLALKTELAKIGCRITLEQNSMTIHPVPALSTPGTVYCSAHNDHRIAMSLSLLELAGYKIVLDDPDCVNKSFPDFWTSWHHLSQPNVLAECV